MPRWPERTREDRFWQRVVVADPEICWQWTGSTNQNYGVFPDRVAEAKWGNRLAHRISWELHYGPIPAGLYVCHKCDNRLCVNPNHLWLGTHQQNQADMGQKGRTYSPAKKLADEDVAEIRRRIGAGESRTSIAAAFNVLPNHISRIKTGARRSPKV